MAFPLPTGGGQGEGAANASPSRFLFLAIPAGEFQMGSFTGLPNEAPPHPVRVPAFRLARHAVSVADYALFLADTQHPAPPNASDPDFNSPSQPITAVSWHDAVAYCAWLSRALHARVVLPTEAQREWAALGRGAPSPPAFTGPRPRPDAVDDGEPNGFGLVGMDRNVHEWCADWYDATYYARSPVEDPRGPESSPVNRRSARGGSWRHDVPWSRGTARSALDPAKTFTDFGFRVAIYEDDDAS